jgi:hypothetical protein
MQGKPTVATLTKPLTKEQANLGTKNQTPGYEENHWV